MFDGNLSVQYSRLMRATSELISPPCKAIAIDCFWTFNYLNMQCQFSGLFILTLILSVIPKLHSLICR